MDFLIGKKSIFETAQIFQSTIKTTKPLDRIATILQTSEVPIPNFSGMYMANSNNCNCVSNSQRKKTRSWTEYEDQRLLAGIYKYGTDNWVSVASFVGNGRTRAQCSQRWTRGLDPRISKDKWSQDDEETLMKLVIQYGTKSWTRIAQEIGNRSDVQCRYHYKQMKQEMDIDSDSSSGITNSNNAHLLNLQPSSISASNSATLPILPNLFDSIPQNQQNKKNNSNSINFMNSTNAHQNIENIRSSPRKISASGSLPSNLNLVLPNLPRNPESNYSLHYRSNFKSPNNFRFQYQEKNNYSTEIHSRNSNRVDLPSISDLLNNVPQINQPIPLFENYSYLGSSSSQSNNPDNSGGNVVHQGNE